jgi:hypothetical protein
MSATPRTPRPGLRGGLNIGDQVTLPEGQKAILKFVGKIAGKPGEYAGVQLVGEYENQGRHSGTFEGVTYFTTSKQNTGLFISYTKLIGSTLRSTAPGPNKRVSMGPMGLIRPPDFTPQRQQNEFSPAKMPMPVRARPSQMTTPRRSSSIAGTSSLMSPPSQRFVRSPEPPSIRREDETVTRQKTYQSPPIDVTTLRNELRETQEALVAKTNQCDQQQRLLHDVEESLRDFQELAKSQGHQEDTEALRKALEERDGKLATLRSEYEQNRQLFRTTIDSLQADLQEANDVYELQIRNLKQSYETQLKVLKDDVGQAQDINHRIAELEYMVSSLEQGLQSSQVSEQNARHQLSQLADIENKLLDKEQELKEASESVERYREILKNRDKEGAVVDDSDSAAAQKELVELKEKYLALEQKHRIAALEADQVVKNLTSEHDINVNTLNEQHQRVVNALKHQLETKVKMMEGYEPKLSSMESMEQDYKSKLSMLESQHTERLSTLTEQLSDLQEKHADLKEDHSRVVAALDAYATSNQRPTPTQDGDSDMEELRVALDALKARNTQLEREKEDLELSLESRTFKELELEREIETFKLERSRSSEGRPFEYPTTPKQKDESEWLTIPVYKPAKKVDPAAGRHGWCGLCEEEGHESLECPYEEEY